MTLTENDIQAIGNMDDKSHLYLTVVGKGNEQHLEVKKQNWVGRLLMFLGVSDASISKVSQYLANHPVKMESIQMTQRDVNKVVRYGSIEINPPITEKMSVLFNKIIRHEVSHNKKPLHGEPITRLEKLFRTILLFDPGKNAIFLDPNQKLNDDDIKDIVSTGVATKLEQLRSMNEKDWKKWGVEKSD